MTINQLRDTYKAEPFRPFTLHVADGRRFEIPHPDFIAHSPQGRTLIVFGDHGRFDILDLLLVTGIEVKASNAHGPHGDSQ